MQGRSNQQYVVHPLRPQHVGRELGVLPGVTSVHADNRAGARGEKSGKHGTGQSWHDVKMTHKKGSVPFSLERLAIDGIVCIPCEEFLLGLHPDRAEWV